MLRLVRIFAGMLVPLLVFLTVSISPTANTYYNFNKYLDAPGGEVTEYLPTSIAPPRDDVFVIEHGAMRTSEYVMMTSLQGITAQTRAKIYVTDAHREKFLRDYLDEHPDLRVQRFGDPWVLAAACADALAGRGFVLYEVGGNPTINMAATVSGAERWLMVESADRAKAEAAGLTLKLDLTAKENGAYLHTQASIYDAYAARLNDNFILHQRPEISSTRDYSIAVGAPCLFVAENDAEGVALRERVFAAARGNAMLFGWTTDEMTYVARASAYGLNVVPSDYCHNLSFMAALKEDAPLEQKNTPRPLTADPTKHYIAVVMSDGDNLQWFENAFTRTDSHFGQRQSTNTAYAMSWTSPPIGYELEQTLMRRVYRTASENDEFVCGVSGIGYINPSKYPAKHLNSFVNYTRYAMNNADLRVVVLLDDVKGPRLIWENAALKPALAYYAKNENIDGGLIQCGHEYRGLDGKIYWSNGKPFISARLSFWYGTSEGGNAPDAWIEEFARTVNALPASIHSAKGYTYINVHPWSTNMANLNYLMSLLDEHIVPVTAQELVELVKANVRQGLI